jgi:hypothetical protein
MFTIRSNRTIDTGRSDRPAGSARSIRRGLKAAVAVGIAAVGLLSTADAASAAGWVYADTNYNGVNDAAGWDVNGDNVYEYIYADTDHNGTWDLYFYATGNWRWFYSFASGGQVWVYQDTAANWLYIDHNGNGLYEGLGYDTNRDGRAEYMLVDNNFDGSYDGNWVNLTTTSTLTPYGAAVRGALDIWLAGVNNSLVSIWL